MYIKLNIDITFSCYVHCTLRMQKIINVINLISNITSANDSLITESDNRLQFL